MERQSLIIMCIKNTPNKIGPLSKGVSTSLRNVLVLNELENPSEFLF